MAEILGPEEAAALETQKYHFDQWFNGQWWKLTEGEDFHKPIERMRTYAFVRARQLGLKLTTKVVGRFLYLMASPMGSEATPKVAPGTVINGQVTNRRGRPTRYPEEIWDGRPRAFYPGKDFQEGGQEAFRQAVRKAATYRGIGIKTSIREDGSVVLQAIPKATTQPPEQLHHQP